MKTFNQEIREKLYELRATVPQQSLNYHYKFYPGFIESYTERQRMHYLQDVDYHLIYLAEAIATNQPLFFSEYLNWCKTFFAGIGILNEHILINLDLIKVTLLENLPPEMAKIVSEYLDYGIEKFKIFNPEIPTFIDDKNPLNDTAKKYLDFLLEGDRKKALEIILETYKKDENLKEIYLKVFQPTQLEIGRLWQMNKITVAQEHFVTAATQLIMSQLYPYLFKGGRKEKSVVVSCINGELHELGARMVADFFEMDGWNSYYLGANTPATSIIRSLENTESRVLAISATMTFHLNNVFELINLVRDNRNTRDIKILVGGYPFNLAQELWKNYGADGYARDAQEAINLAEIMFSNN